MSEITENNKLIIQISKKLQNISLENFSTKQLKDIASMLLIDKAKEKLNKEVNKENFSYEKVLDNWLKYGGKKENSKKIYLRAISYFENFLKTQGLHILDVRAKHIDHFINMLEKLPKISNTTKRLIISSTSSFFSSLRRWDYIEHNYFKGAKSPKVQRSRVLKIPSTEEIEKIYFVLENYKYCSGRGSYKAKKAAIKNLVILELLASTGLRVGAVKTIEVGQNGIIRGISKGQKFELKISSLLIKKLRRIDLSKITENSIQIFMKKACKIAGLPNYSPHSLRHHFAVEYYKKTKDIYTLKKLINHSNIVTTENYLKSLKVL